MRSLLLVLILSFPAVAQQPSCVKVWDGKTGSGSGTVVRPQLVLTNRHMVSKQDPRITTQDGKEYMGRVRKVSADAAVDLALVQVPDLPLAPVELAPSRPDFATRLRQFGFPLGQFKPLEGLRHKLFATEDRSLFTDMQTDHGDSGAGLFNTNNQLVGVQVGVVNDPRTNQPQIPKVSMYVDIKDIQRFVGPTIVVVSATWCGPCQKLKKELPKVTIDTQVFETDGKQNPYEVQSYPTLILYSPDFVEIKRTTGFMTTSEINEWVK